MVFSCSVCLDVVNDYLVPIKTEDPSKKTDGGDQGPSTSSPDVVNPPVDNPPLAGAHGAGEPSSAGPIRRGRGRPTTRGSLKAAAARKILSRPLKDACSQIVVTHCGHIFHLQCLTRWLDSLGHISSGHCPECKRGIRSRKFQRIYPHDADVRNLLEDLESFKEREEKHLEKVEALDEKHKAELKAQKEHFEEIIKEKTERSEEQNQHIRFLLEKYDNEKMKVQRLQMKERAAANNGAVIDLTSDRPYIEVDLSGDDPIVDVIKAPPKPEGAPPAQVAADEIIIVD